MSQQLTFNDVDNMIKNKQLGYHNFYNLDIPTTTQYSIKHYKNFQHDDINISQNINTVFLDIELYTYNKGLDSDKIHEGSLPINIVTFISTTDKIIWSYIILFDSNIKTFGISNDPNFKFDEFIINVQNKLKEDLTKLGYLGSKFIDADYEIKLKVYSESNEGQMLCDVWQNIHNYDPDVLSSWNGDNFDYPYYYYRLCQLYSSKDAKNIMSKFGEVRAEKGNFSIFEYTISDSLKMYKPRSEQGLVI